MSMDQKTELEIREVRVARRAAELRDILENGTESELAMEGWYQDGHRRKYRDSGNNMIVVESLTEGWVAHSRSGHRRVDCEDPAEGMAWLEWQRATGTIPFARDCDD